MCVSMYLREMSKVSSANEAFVLQEKLGLQIVSNTGRRCGVMCLPTVSEMHSSTLFCAVMSLYLTPGIRAQVYATKSLL